MNEKRYQVFISSTYEDLKEERKAVEETIIRAGDFPVGMEAFPAADEEQFKFIKSIIDKCDYYVLIIAGRYGSLAPDGYSYTEKEYRYAVEVGVPVLVMLHGERGSLPVKNTEKDQEQSEKLDKFIEEVSKDRIRKDWTTIDGLKLAVREALDHAKATKERPGWIRGNLAASTDTLERLVAAQRENEALRAELQEAAPKFASPENIAGLETPITLSATCYVRKSGQSFKEKRSFTLETTFGEIFELLAPHLMQPKTDNEVNEIIGKSVWSRHNPNISNVSSFTVTDEEFQTIKIQLMALGLVTVEEETYAVKGLNTLYWSLTPAGSQEMIIRRAITKED